MDRHEISAADIRQMEAAMADVPIVGLALDVPMRAQIERHSHGRGQLMYCSSGVMVIQCNGFSWVAPPHRAVWMPPGVEHTFLPTTRVQLAICCCCQAPPEMLSEKPCFVEVSPLLRELIVKAVNGQDNYKSPAHKERLLRLIVDEIETIDSPPFFLPDPADSRIRRICEYLKSNPADPRTLEDWSAVAGASGRTLARLFIRETGMSFASWRRQARLIHASVRLGLGQSVTTAALESGYESPSAFIEMFRRTVGDTPGRYCMPATCAGG